MSLAAISADHPNPVAARHADVGSARASVLPLPRRAVAAATAGCALLLPILQLDGLWTAVSLLSLGLLIASAVVSETDDSRSRLGLVEWWPIAFLLGIFGVTLLGLTSWAVGAPIWAVQPVALTAWGMLVAAPLVVAWRRAGLVSLACSVGTVATSVFTVATPVLALALLPFGWWARLVTLGTDFPRHVMIALRTMTQGWLEYSSSGYPRSIHSALSLLQSASGDASVSGMWQAAQGTLLGMFGLMAVSVYFLARQASMRLGVRGRALTAVPASAPALLAVGAWTTAMLPDGFLTSFEAGLILAAAASLAWYSESEEPLTPPLVLLGLSALMAHAWLLLVPVVAAPAAWLLARNVGRRTNLVALAGAAVLAVAVALPVIGASMKTFAISSIATAGTTRIPQPSAGWVMLFLLASLGILLLSRSGALVAAKLLALMVIALVAMLLFVLYNSGSGLSSSYYFIKTAVTPTPVLIGLAAPAAGWLAWSGTRSVSARSAAARGVAGAAIAGALAVLLLFAVQTPSASRIRESLTAQLGQPAVYVPLAEQIISLAPSSEDAPVDVLVWGLSPYLDPTPDGLLEAGRLDFIANGALIAGGYRVADGSIGGAVLRRDAPAVCDYLRTHPETLRVTGPFAEGSLGLLSDSGCPLDIIRPDEWVTVKFGPAWYVGTEWEDSPFGKGFASWTEIAPLVAPASDTG